MSSSSHDSFIRKLEREAELQASVHRTQLIPRQIGGLARFVAHYPWQTVVVLSGLTAVVLEVWQ